MQISLPPSVANSYKYKTGGKAATSTDYKNTCAVADALYGHSRMKLPYGLTVIGYERTGRLRETCSRY